MKITKLNIALFALSMTGSALCADTATLDVNTIVDTNGVASNSLTDWGTISSVMENIVENGYATTDSKALTGVCRAQFSDNGSNLNLGRGDNFNAVFPKYQSEATVQLKALLDPSSEKPVREKAFKMLQLIHWLSFDNSFTRHNIPTSGAVLGADLVSFRSDGMSALSAAAYEQENEMFDVILELLSKEDLNKKKSAGHRTIADQTKHMVRTKGNKASVESKIDTKLSS